MQNQGALWITGKYRIDSQRAGILLGEVRQVDISKVDKQHPNSLFGGVQEPAERQDS